MTMHTIEFPFSFQFPNGGIQDLSSAVTVCEPSYDNRHVYRRMQAGLGDWAKAYMLMQAELRAKTGDKSTEVDEAPVQASEAQADTESDTDIINQMRIVLGTSGFEELANYIQKELTNNRSLAYVGSDLTTLVRDRVPVTDLVWMNIANAGGMQAIDRVLSAFINFFLPGQPSEKSERVTRGSTSPSEPASSAPEASRSKRR